MKTKSILLIIELLPGINTLFGQTGNKTSEVTSENPTSAVSIPNFI